MGENGNKTLDYATPVRHRRRRWVTLACAAAAAILLGLMASRSVIVRAQRKRALQAEQAALKVLQTTTSPTANKPSVR